MLCFTVYISSRLRTMTIENSNSSICKFIETLKSPEFKEKIDFLDRNDFSPQNLTTKITELLLETCDKSGIKPKTFKTDKNSEPWFDDECKHLKDSIKKKCKELRVNSKDENLRKKYPVG